MLIAGVVVLAGSGRAVEAQECAIYTITAYSAEQYPGRTADGTSTWQAINQGQALAAGSWNLALGAEVEVEGMGRYVIRDRGYLEARHIDVLVPTTAEAKQIGYQKRRVCVVEE